MNELEQWYNQISSFKRLNLSEAQDLYRKTINTSNELLRKTYMDKVILGTLYVVYEYINRNKLELFISSSYDMNDIISAFNEVWIKRVKNGDLLKVNEYSLLFKYQFFKEVCDSLCGDRINVNEQIGISIDYFVELLAIYINLKNTSSITLFQKIVKEKFYDTGKLYYYTYDSVINLIPFLDAIYDNLNFDKSNDLKLSKKKIYDFLELLIRIGLMDLISSNLPDNNNMEDSVIRHIALEHFIINVDKALTDERMKQIIHERYGLDDDNSMYLQSIAEKHKITRERVRQIEIKALSKLRYNQNIRKYKEENI